MNEPIVLVKLGDPEQKPQLYACPKCGHVNSPLIYACRDDMAHEAAKQAAADCYSCRTHNNCQHCGAECGKGWLACDKCRRERKLAACEKVPPETIDACFGFDSDTFYASVEDALDDGCTLVHPAELRHYSVDIERLIEGVLDEHHEDASVDDLKGLDALTDAAEAFNKAQTSGSYDCDSKKVADLSALTSGK